MSVNTACFTSKFSAWIRQFAYWLACRYLYRDENRYKSKIEKELISTRWFIIKVHRKETVNRLDFFSIHKRVRKTIDGGKYGWYYEKYQIVLSSDSVTKSTIYKYGYYPYYWE